MASAEQKTRIEALEKALREMIDDYAAFVEWLGPCEHDIGKCECKERAILARARAKLKDAAP